MWLSGIRSSEIGEAPDEQLDHAASIIAWVEGHGSQ